MIFRRRFLAGGIPFRQQSLKRLEYQPNRRPGELTTKSKRKKRPDGGWSVAVQTSHYLAAGPEKRQNSRQFEII
jgi:hypothetical protein